jgi:hypothetical protein
MRGLVRATSSTKRSLLARVIVGLLVGAAIVPVSAGSSQAITGTVDSSSFGLSTNVSLLTMPVVNQAVGAPAAAYPAGPTSNSTASVSVPNAATTGVTAVTANGDPLADTATASSSVANLSLLPGVSGGINSTGTVGSSCSTDGTVSGTTATASTVGLSIPGAGVIPDQPTVGQTFNIALLGINIVKIVLNEQSTSTTGGLRKITVNALHLTLLGGVLGAVGSGDIIVGHSECTATVQTAPTLTSFTPVQGPQAGGTTVTINGNNFLGASSVLIGGVSTPILARISPTQLTVKTPAHAPGLVDIQVVNGAGTTSALVQKFTYLPTPTVTALSPATGPAAGGTTVTITGTNLGAATAVTFDGTPATSFTPVNATTITAVAPPGTGTDFVQVTAPGGTSVTGAGNAFVYVAAPVLTSISPTSGPPGGGTTVTLTGTGFTAAAQVKVDGTALSPASVTFVDSTTLRIPTPAHAVAAVPITVTTTGGTTLPQTFNYLPLPTATSLNPTSGSILGTNPLVITGTNLTSVSSVTIDGTNAPIISQPIDGLTLNVTVPAHLATGPVNVVLTGPGSVTTPAGTYVYTLTVPPASGAPTVTSLTPTNGPQAGGTSVQIAGTNFTTTNSVKFGTVNATSYVIDSPTQITAIAPAATSFGSVSVTVTNPSGVSAITGLGTYLYNPLAPGLTSLTPDHGPTTGGTTVTLNGASFTPVSTVTLDGTALSATYVDATHLTATMPPHAAGGVSLAVQTLGLPSGNLTYTYQLPPTVNSLSPVSGSTAGATLVTVTGTNLDRVTGVTIGGADVLLGGGSNAATLTFTTPAHAEGSVPVLLTNSEGLSLNAGSFLYVQPAPVATSVSPNHGPLAGGNSVTVTGSNLTGVTGVTIGGITATSVNVVDSTHVSATVPASSTVGATTLSVTGPAGTSATLAYTYDPVPTLTGLSPAQGAATGNTSVAITGSGFTNSTGVRFGSTLGTGFTVVDDSHITVLTPAHAAGLVDVTVTGPSGTSAVTAADRYTFIDTTATPVVTGLSPNLGSTTVGTSVTVTGTGLFGATTVAFGGSNGSTVTVLDDNTLTVTSPAHAAGTVDVIVTKPGPLTSSGTGTGNDFTYVAPGSIPVVSGVIPARGPLTGGTLVYLTGVGFTGATTVTVGGTAVVAPGFTVLNDTQISVTTPAHSAGTADITVTKPAGTSVVNSNDVFTYVAAPSVGGLTPTQGPVSGGTNVTITGTDFTGATGVNFGTDAGSNVTVNSDSSITVTSPPHAGGQVDVTIVGAGGTSAAVSADRFTYLAAPAVTSLTPTSGPIAGNTVVTITGANFTGATAVSFGGTNGTGLSASSTSITVTSPPHAAGLVDVIVTGPGGSSTVVAGDQFTFIPPAPTVTSLTPVSGPIAGGTTVTVTGTGFTSATTVNFGAVAGTNVLIGSDTSLTVSSPAQGAGQIDVTVVGPGGTSAAVNGDHFTYNPVPVVSSLSPPNGPIAGGTSVTITGTGFTGTTAVQFGGVNGTNVTGVTSTSITVTTPAHAVGGVDVIVLGPNGASALGGPQFTYTQPTPVIGSLSPTSGPEGGGTSVTITGTGFTGATTVNFGLTAGSNVVVSSDTSLSVTSPLHAAGTVPVTVVSPGVTSNATINFTFNPAPAITAVLSPIGGTTAGGTSVTITGTNFTNATLVKFGTVSGTNLVVVDSATITVTSPPHAAGQVDVQVTTPDGTSPIVADDHYLYAVPPVIVTGVTPNTGGFAGGTTVTVSGSGFTGATGVTFGLLTGTIVIVNSDTTLTVTSPALGVGTVDVRVTGPGGTSATSPADQFTYAGLLAPTVTGVSPDFGTDLGNTPVTVTGTGFIPGVSTVTFGAVTVPVGQVTVNSGTSLTVASPPQAAGLVYVQVSNLIGTSIATTTANQYTYQHSLPTVTGVSPLSGTTLGGQTVTVTGTGFVPAATTLNVDGVATPATVVNGSTLTFVSPAHAAGSVDIEVANGNGTGTALGQFTYVTPAPSVTGFGVGMSSGSTNGGQTITINGTNLTGASTVSFGGTPSTTITNVTPTSLDVITPAHLAGVVDVQVTTPGGQSAVNAPADRFTFVQPAPAVTGLSSHTGPTSGGALITVTGTDFTGVTAVNFGSFAAAFTFVSPTQINVTTPAGTGLQNVRITTTAGISPIVSADEYTFVAIPTVGTVSPANGPVAGGTLVTISGSGFTGLTAPGAVQFGGVNATSYTVVNGTTITAFAPARIAGIADVTVTSGGGTSPTSSNTKFTYIDLPAVIGLSPTTGQIFGGDVITITGTDFTGTSTVFFGTVPVTPTTVSGTTITVTAPPGTAGTVDITVVTPYGTSSGAGSANDYTYTLPGAPAVGAVSPSAGPATGGTVVTITGSGFTGTTGVTFGGVAATTFTVVNDTTITATTPAHSSGDAAVVITTPGGTSTGGPTFRYASAGTAPVVGGVAPSKGPAAGGNRVTITGAGFTGATKVLFGGVAGTGLVLVNDTTVTVLVPAGTPAGGQVDVTVSGPNGISVPRPGAVYTYVPLTDLPTVSKITPEVGPVAGGTRLTITGTHFDETTTVSFDGVKGTGVTLGPDVGAALRRGMAMSGTGFRAAYSNQLTVVAPPHAAGPVTLVITNIAGSASFPEAFTFIPLLKASTAKATVKAGSTTKFAVGGADYIELKATACSEPAGKGSTQLAANKLSCTYTAPDTAGTQTFTMTLVDVLGQTATRTVTVTVDDDGGTGTGGGGGNDGDDGDDGGTGTGGGGGNNGDGGSGTGGSGGNDGDGSGSGGLAFTGTPYLLIPGLIGGLLLVLVGTGLLTGDRLRTAHGRSTSGSGTSGSSRGSSSRGRGTSGTENVGISLVTPARETRRRDGGPDDDAA